MANDLQYAEEIAASCTVCGNHAETSPCPHCVKALELLQGFAGIEHWEHVAAIASRIVQLPSKERIIMEILLLEMED
jgi:hypothetical protein